MYYHVGLLKCVILCVMLCGVHSILASSRHLQPCDSVRDKDNILSPDTAEKWIKWARLYSFCKQYDAGSNRNTSSTDNGCNTLECKKCLSVCDGKDHNISNCEANCSSIHCRHGCAFYKYLFHKSAFNFTQDKSDVPTIKNNTKILVNPRLDSINFSWPRMEPRGRNSSSIPTIYLVSMRANKNAQKEHILGLIQHTDYVISSAEMCTRVYQGHHYEIGLQFAITVYPNNMNGPSDFSKALSLSSEYTQPIVVPPLKSLQIKGGAPLFEATKSPTHDNIIWTVYWPTHNDDSRATGVKYSYKVGSCTDMTNYMQMLRLNRKVEKESTLQAPLKITVHNTKKDELKTCEIQLDVRLKYGKCFLSEKSSKVIKYNGCKTVSGYKNSCGTQPIPTLRYDTVVYNRNVTAIGPTCQNYSVGICPNNANISCKYCNESIYNVLIEWTPLNINPIIEYYTIRWGSLRFGMISNAIEITVPSNATSYLIPSVIVTSDVIIGVQVHAQSNVSDILWRIKPNSIKSQSLVHQQFIPIHSKQPVNKVATRANESTTVAVVVIVLLFVSLCTLAMFIIYKRWTRRKKRDGKRYGDEIIMKEIPPVADEWEIYPSSVQLEQKIGEGAFGTVYSATMETSELIKSKYSQQCSGASIMNERTKVAVKFLKEGAEESECKDFQEEITLMKSAGYHENIINLIGCSTVTKPMFIIIEFMQHGDLLHYMRAYRTNEIAENGSCDCDASDDVTMTSHYSLSPQDVMSFAWQIASGMEYLCMHDIVHRDLAARNILISEDKRIKVSDFGLSRHVSNELIYISSNKTRRLPIKWMAVEAIYHQEFTSASDVWAYGVVLFEIVTLGGTPYPSLGNRELCRMLKSGYRMEKPDNCDDTIYDIMLHCWNEVPGQRPTFTELREHLEHLVEKGDLYFSFDINENETYYNVASFKSIGSDKQTDEDELFTKEYNEKPIQVKNLPQSVNKSKSDPQKYGGKGGEQRVELEPNRYFSPQSIKTLLATTDNNGSFDNPVFHKSDNDAIDRRFSK